MPPLAKNNVNPAEQQQRGSTASNAAVEEEELMNPDRLSDRDSAHDDLLVARFRTSEGSGPVAISPGSTLDTPSGTIAIGPDPDAGLDLLRQPGVERLFDSASGSDSLGDVPETACGPGEEASARKDALLSTSTYSTYSTGGSIDRQNSTIGQGNWIAGTRATLRRAQPETSTGTSKLNSSFRTESGPRSTVDGRPIRLLMIRHGESVGNVDPAIYNSTPDHAITLTESGQRMADQAGKELSKHLTKVGSKRVKMLVSPFLRTRETASHVLRGCKHQINAGVAESALLVEQDWGLFEGSGMAHSQSKYPKEFERMKRMRAHQGSFYARMPHGESFFDVCIRVQGLFSRILFEFNNEENPIDTFVIVSHGVTIRALVMMWCQFTPEWVDASANPPNCSIRELCGDTPNWDTGYIFGGFGRNGEVIDLDSKYLRMPPQIFEYHDEISCDLYQETVAELLSANENRHYDLVKATSQEAWKAVRVSTRGMAGVGGTGIAAVAKLAMLRAAHSHSKGHLLEGKAHSAAEETHAGSIPRSGFVLLDGPGPLDVHKTSTYDPSIDHPPVIEVTQQARRKSSSSLFKRASLGPGRPPTKLRQDGTSGSSSKRNSNPSSRRAKSRGAGASTPGVVAATGAFASAGSDQPNAVTDAPVDMDSSGNSDSGPPLRIGSQGSRVGSVPRESVTTALLYDTNKSASSRARSKACVVM